MIVGYAFVSGIQKNTLHLLYNLLYNLSAKVEQAEQGKLNIEIFSPRAIFPVHMLF
jgi:hypothetical protein